MHFNLCEHHTPTGFKNPDPGFEDRGFNDLIRWGIIDRLSGKKQSKHKNYAFRGAYQHDLFTSVHQNTYALTWIGHSSFLITINGINILTDPVWSRRCSPYRFIGPERCMAPGIPFEALPEIDLVLISHNHYDHLDINIIKQLGNTPTYFIPLRVGTPFNRIGITNLSEYDWWDRETFRDIRITSTPAQHFSGRGLRDRNKTLWCGWIVEYKDFRLYFAGDSGYFSGFREIGRRFGPLDIACLPIGAYLPRWFMKPFHLSPDEAVQAFLDLNARTFVAMHWGTFDLADEPMDDPPLRLKEEISRRGLDPSMFWILQHGESRLYQSPASHHLSSGDLYLDTVNPRGNTSQV